jgi:hypothetical protein
MWEMAIAQAMPLLGLPETTHVDTALEMTLGESRFGAKHWTLGFSKKAYYLVKPILPRKFTRLLRRFYNRAEKETPDFEWLIESRISNFQWGIMANLLRVLPSHEFKIKSLWPEGKRYALVLTHDVEASAGQEFVCAVADLEESLGFRSSFNFVPRGYHNDMRLVHDLRRRGFEVGIHGLKHDGKLFNSRASFERSAAEINHYLKLHNAVGFRSPLTLRNPEWMQSLEIEYDLSFFDSDPFEPIPGGTMSIWPFFLGHFVELPYTLVQDYTLTDILKETTPHLWLKKVDFIRENCGMVLLNSHPDYLKNTTRLGIYEKFLQAMKEKKDYWHALPCEVARWWKHRSTSNLLSKVSLQDDTIYITSLDYPNPPISIRLPTV